MSTNEIKLPFLKTDKAITVFFGPGESQQVSKGDSRYKQVVAAIRDNLWGSLRNILDVKNRLVTESNGKIYLINGILQSDHYVVPAMLGTRIVELFHEGLSPDSYVRFLEKVNENPDPRAVEETYGFVEHCNLPVCEDGDFLAYKMITKDFLDIFTKSVDNSVGQVITMERDLVDADCNRTCSAGLHFCSEGYLGKYGTERNHDQMVIVKINPRDVVAIPTDYKFAKGRCCRYEVVDTITWDNRIKPVYNDDYTKPEDIQPIPEPTPEGKDGTRWELRLSSDGTLLEVCSTRSEARKLRATTASDSFIWDTAHEVATGPHPEDWDVDVDLTLVDDDEDEEETTTDEDERWEVRGSETGDVMYTFSSRKLAREYVNDDEFIWDTKKEKIEKGYVNIPCWKP
jgi:hypothetical protein